MRRFEHKNYIEYRNHSNKLDREDGPAVEYISGMWSGRKVWYQNGRLHREDGPAFIENDGSEWWYFNNKLHRLDGPAVIMYNYEPIIKQWWVWGNRVQCGTQEKFERIIKLLILF